VVTAKAIAIAIAGVVLSGLTFGLGLATAAGELHARGIDHLPAGTAGMFAGSVGAAALFGLIGVALGYIARSTVAAVVGAVGWVVFAEYAILHTVAPKVFNWLISGTATVLTGPPMPGNTAPTPLTAAAVLAADTVVLLAAATWLVRRRDVA
jgi:ABC-type transport system involved in multi-copper enzyme maturation permease subunit